jgi:hypothetical protein
VLADQGAGYIRGLVNLTQYSVAEVVGQLTAILGSNAILSKQTAQAAAMPLSVSARGSKQVEINSSGTNHAWHPKHSEDALASTGCQTSGPTAWQGAAQNDHIPLSRGDNKLTNSSPSPGVPAQHPAGSAAGQTGEL